MAGSIISIRNYTRPEDELSEIDFGYIAQDQTGFPYRIIIFNNFDSLTGVGDVKNFKVCAYDNENKTALTSIIKNKWIQVRQVEYNGIAITDPQWASIGGDTKYTLPYNGGKINGSDDERGDNTVIEFRMIVPHDLDLNGFHYPYIAFEYEEV
jgi:hypothetical protein